MRDPDLAARAQRAQRVQIPQQQVRRAESPPEGTGEHVGQALPGAPLSFSVGRHAPDQIRDMATSWISSDLPGQVTDQFAARPGPQAAPDQLPASG